MSVWTSLHEIMQDLSVAQGCVVPASIETFGSSRPPALNIEEETEEEFYECSGGGDFEPPDCNLIQEMLNRVKAKKDDDADSFTSDLDPCSPEFVPQVAQKKIKRNVALSSIITAKELELASKRPIPNNVIPTMFKRKTCNNSDSEGKKSVSPIQTYSPDKYNQYVPSSAANEYYNKYLEKSKMRERFEIDIWTKAEKQMKEIDERKRREAEAMTFQITSEDVSLAGGVRGYDTVMLPQHRHFLTGQCVVCTVAANHGYDFKDTL